jgi:tRNA/tmRNA/rRNA uracil-C5-methylase (TrmA/RlmC/RlmD family)
MDSLDFKPDSIILDPPRVGLHKKAVAKIIEYDLPEIIYVSCNPKTFAENMEGFVEAGYKLDYLKAYDNFPFTKHIELLTRIVK